MTTNKRNIKKKWFLSISEVLLIRKLVSSALVLFTSLDKETKFKIIKKTERTLFWKRVTVRKKGQQNKNVVVV